MMKKDISKLVRKVIIDKTGKKTTVYVRSDKSKREHFHIHNRLDHYETMEILISLEKRSYKKDEMLSLAKRYLTNILNFYNNRNSLFCFSDNGKLLGAMALRRRKNKIVIDYLALNPLYVDKENRHTGVGSKLLYEVMLEAIDTNKPILLMPSVNAVSFYSKMGFARYEQDINFLILTPDKAKKIIKERIKKSIDNEQHDFLYDMMELEKELGFPFVGRKQIKKSYYIIKGKKDISKLQKKQIINKLGKKETVYVKNGEEVKQDKPKDNSVVIKQDFRLIKNIEQSTVEKLLTEVDRDEYDKNTVQKNAKDVFKDILLDTVSDNRVYSVDFKGNVLGGVAYDEDKKTYYINYIAVHPIQLTENATHKGISSALLINVMKKAVQNNKTITLSALDNAVSFYKKWGFEFDKGSKSRMIITPDKIREIAGAQLSKAVDSKSIKWTALFNKMKQDEELVSPIVDNKHNVDDIEKSTHPEKRIVHKDNKTFQQTFYISNDSKEVDRNKKLLEMNDEELFDHLQIELNKNDADIRDIEKIVQYMAKSRKHVLFKSLIEGSSYTFDSFIRRLYSPSHVMWYISSMLQGIRELTGIKHYSEQDIASKGYKVFLEGWFNSSRGITANLMQTYLQESLGIKNTFLYYETEDDEKLFNNVIDFLYKTELEQWLKNSLHKMYEHSQSEFRKDKIKSVKLYRGVKQRYNVASVCESFTDDQEVANGFDGHSIIEQEIPVERIFMHYNNRYWNGRSDEFEYIVINDKEK